ncbi:hypothetical protein M0802_012726 [Mischocyttarus mexicanus]|nr:hypothetical protein M0802_012726 [Mischocyttarus mexicanus]
MFIGRRESKIDSESSDENVVSFRRKFRNRISSSSGSDTDESYASEDIEKLLTELGLDEEEKLNTANDSLNNIQFKMQLKIIFNLNKKSAVVAQPSNHHNLHPVLQTVTIEPRTKDLVVPLAAIAAVVGEVWFKGQRVLLHLLVLSCWLLRYWLLDC